MINLINKTRNLKNFFKEASNLRSLKIKKITPNHKLEQKLTVSITAKAERFTFLHLTLSSILNQTIHPDEIILWIEREDKRKLPKKILNFKSYGVKILFCKNLKSFNKIIHTIKLRKDNYIITFDDDIIYHKSNIEYLTNKASKFKNQIIANRVHKIKLKNKVPIEYNKWKWNHNKSEKNRLNFQTGVYGVLYPPKCFYKDMIKESLFKKLTPLADDIWIYWMIRMNKRYVVWSGFNKKNTESINFDYKSLRRINISKNFNDIQIKNLINFYGFPN